MPGLIVYGKHLFASVRGIGWELKSWGRVYMLEELGHE